MKFRKLLTVGTLFLAASASAQNTDTAFQNEWLRIDTLIVQKDLTRTALDRVAAVYKKAKQQQLPAQSIKCLIYQYSLQQRLTDRSPNLFLKQVEEELVHTRNETERAILHALLAKLYLQYRNNAFWQISQRKKTGTPGKDITTWGLDEFSLAIDQHYLSSLKNAQQLQQVPVSAYDAVIKKGNSRLLRPTLYDLLAHEALDYFKAGEYSGGRVSPILPADRFLIPVQQALAPMEVFTTHRFTTKDSSSSQWQTLQLFQQLMRFHRNDVNKEALLELNTERIQWIYQQTDISGKEDLYTAALEEMTKLYPTSISTSQAWHLLARKEADKAASYQPFQDTTHRWAYQRAREIAEKALLRYTETIAHPGISNLHNLLAEIKQKELSTQTEAVNLPGKAFRALVSYRNVDTVYIRIIRLANKQVNEKTDNVHRPWQKMLEQAPDHELRLALPGSDDHQSHATEIMLNKLPVGQYALLCSDNSSFNDSLHKISLQYFQVSQLSYIRNGRDYFVLNRATGQPVPEVRATVYEYRYSLGEGEYTKAAELITDKNGHFRYADNQRAANTKIELTLKEDRLLPTISEHVYYNYEMSPANRDSISYEINNSRVFFFTDRSMYRPGQTVFFKGIAVTKDVHTKSSKLITSTEKHWVYMNDVNGKHVDSIQAVLNSYGSFSGNFRIPAQTLTGRFSITVRYIPAEGNTFSVEEYKRPAFQVSFEKVQKAYRLNDSITITGNAVAYAGNTISGSKVVYNITRTKHYPMPWGYRMNYDRGSDDRQITSGESVTDDSGHFAISFKALAGDITSRSNNTYFSYRITADITDSNGETRSAETMVRAGSVSLLLSLNMPEKIEVDSLKKINLTTTNLNNEKLPALVQIQIYSLQEPGRVIRKRYWERPDQFVMQEADFIKIFPSDEYHAESDYRTWPTHQLVHTGNVDTKEMDAYPVTAGTLAPGFYRIEATATDPYGQKISTASYLQVYHANTHAFGNHTLVFHDLEKKSIQPGETAHFISYSQPADLFVIRQKKQNNQQENYQFIQKTKGVEDIRFTATEADRGGIGITETFVWDNRVYSFLYHMEVPWRNKELAIRYETYRNKTEPGSKETWTLTIKGNGGEKTTAELLTAMYDASLDQFSRHEWHIPYLWRNNWIQNDFSGNSNFTENISTGNYLHPDPSSFTVLVFDQLAEDASLLWNQNLARLLNHPRHLLSRSLREKLVEMNDGIVTGYANTGKKTIPKMTNALPVNSMHILQENESNKISNNATQRMLAKTPAPDKEEEIRTQQAQSATGIDLSNITPRKNFKETAFFFPQLYADSTGKYSFSFTMPEALTQWKWMSFAHTRELALGYTDESSIVTQKKLMVQPNTPRFLREGDHIELSSKIVNLSEQELTGQVSLELLDAGNNSSVDGWFQNVFPVQYFTVEAGKATVVKFPIQVPFNFNRPLTWRIRAGTALVNDGEENTIPVVTNRQLVTESLPLFIKGDTTQTFRFDKLLHNTSESLSQQGLTVEFSSNPVWNAVQALPYLMEYPYECAEQSFNRLYANLLASWIVNRNSRIRKVLAQWQQDSSSRQSTLQKNEELKQLLLQETPWVLQAENEEQQKKNIALLFDLVKLENQAAIWIDKLAQMQLSNGAFSWFRGGYEDRYITNYILTGIGKLKRLGALSPEMAGKMRNITVKALRFLDGKIQEDYRVMQKSGLSKNTEIKGTHADYLYMRSFFRDIAQQSPEAYQFLLTQAKKYWTTQNSFYKAKLGLVFYRTGNEQTATKEILPALLENAITDPQQGMYWKSAYAGNWYQSPIEHQSMLISFMSEITQDTKNEWLNEHVYDMKTWLLLNKQSNHWKTTIATADACYALLANGTDWLNTEKKVAIRLGQTEIHNDPQQSEAGTGYFKKRIDGNKIDNQMGNITVTVQSSSPASAFNGSAVSKYSSPSWGAVYWQYFEDLDKITPAATPLSLTKKLFIEKNSGQGKILQVLKEGEPLQIGDKLIVRLELRSNRDLDYVHLKDMRAASMEPTNIFSGYRWQDGLGYYESTRDVSSNFFIDHLQKGTYVFEYPMFITHTGEFSAGIASIQCMYAPEFTSHSEGIRIRVTNP
ncbi:MAG: alpha-2-macroglobulin [Bacteroidetes bacterium]|nr:alpha-2-macroglobulin [Bacteroidota bacterium]